MIDRSALQEKTMQKKFIVTITPPTPNGDLHLGHLSGPFLAADVCTRALRQQGHDVLLLCYSDDYQSYMPRKARQLRQEPLALARFNSKQIQLALEAVNIACDSFLQASTSAAFSDNATRYYRLAERAGQLVRRADKVFYCDACNVYGYEGLGRSRCNWCGASSDASQCEACARAPDVNQIDDMTCMLCQHPMHPVTVSRWSWQMGKNFAALRQHYHAAPMRPALRFFLDDMLRQDDLEWGITRPGDAGLQLDAAIGAMAAQPLHTWFMGIAGYRAALQAFLEQHPGRGTLADWWHEDTQLVHFMGFDCSFSHALGYAALQTLDREGPQPGICLTNQFLQLDGQDFSTSRGHAVWIREITGQHPIDAVRLFTALYAPENAPDNFDRARFETWRRNVFDRLFATVHADLAGPPAAGMAPAVPASAAVDAACAAWGRAATLAHFSMATMASAALDVFAWLASQDDVAARRQYWPVFARLVSPLCPHMAQEINALLAAHALRAPRPAEVLA
jgi:methionyl-tRNA synthetase